MGSRALPANYRPIAPMQVDVKVLSRVMTSRDICRLREGIRPCSLGLSVSSDATYEHRYKFAFVGPSTSEGKSSVFDLEWLDPGPV
jgi:hypothetical protein